MGKLRHSRITRLALAGSIAALLAGSAPAQTVQSQAAALIEAKREAMLAAQRSERLETEAARARDSAAQARAARAALAARVQAAEADIDAAEARVRLIEALRSRQRDRLATQQGPITRLAAALQTMARRPPALALVQPGSTSDLVHVRLLLASALPVVRARTAGLRAEVARADQLRRNAAQALALLRGAEQRLGERRLELARLEAAHRRRSVSLTDAAMYEQDRAIALGEEARDIVDLMHELDKQAGVRERLMKLPGPVLRPPVPGRASLPPPDRGYFAESPPPYRLPVVGDLVTGLGEVSESGVRARGLTLRTRPGAQVVAPTAGRIAYSGIFRGYGQIVIIDHGRGWMTLITGLGNVSVDVGERVDRGSPIGSVQARKPAVTVELRKGGQPVDITRLVGLG